jgi:hypothetical protein
MTVLGDTARHTGTKTTPPIPVPPCHCEERSDAAIQRNPRATHRITPAIPHNASDWIATSVLFETFLAMTALGQASENRDAPPRPFPSPLLSLRGAQRRGNPATVWASPMFWRCHREDAQKADAAIQRSRRVKTLAVPLIERESQTKCRKGIRLKGESSFRTRIT